MKKLLFGLITTVMFGSIGFGQSNNPFNQYGKDIVYVSKIIADDYKQGKFKEVSQETLDYYYDKYLQEYPKVKIEEYDTIFENFSKSTNQSIIENSGLSKEAQEFVEKSISNYSTTELVEDVKNSKLDNSEKESVLKILAVNFNLVSPEIANKSINSGTQKGPCSNFDFVNYDNNNNNNITETNSQGGSIHAWGAFGSLLGAPFGPVGVFIGGVIGVTVGIIHVYSSNSSSSSGSGGPKP